MSGESSKFLSCDFHKNENYFRNFSENPKISTDLWFTKSSHTYTIKSTKISSFFEIFNAFIIYSEKEYHKIFLAFSPTSYSLLQCFFVFFKSSKCWEKKCEWNWKKNQIILKCRAILLCRRGERSVMSFG